MAEYAEHLLKLEETLQRHPLDPVLLADEPTANLDSETGARVLELFREVAKRESKALVIVTHDPKVRAVSDRVLGMHDGLLAA